MNTHSHRHIYVRAYSHNACPLTITAHSALTTNTIFSSQAKDRDAVGLAQGGIEPLPEALDEDYLTDCYQQAKYVLTDSIIPYHTIPYYNIPYHTIPYHTIPYYTIPYHTIPYHTILYYTIL